VSDVVPDVGRHAVLVDAGYLYASVGQLVLGRTSRREFRVAAEPLIGALMARADRTTPGGLLRMYWYDAARDRVHTVEQRQIAALPNVKVRLGNLNSAGQQKGVDAQLRQDLELLAKHRAVSDVVLIAGDEDMVPAVEAAQAYGVRVHVWGVEPPYGVNQAERLVWEADTVDQLDAEFCRPYLELEPGVGEEEAAVAAEPREERHAVPTPADVFAARKLSTPPPKPVAVAAGPPERPDRPGPERPEMEQIGARIAARWLLTRGRENVADLLPGPVLPTVIDKELLVEAEEEISRSLRPYEEARRALRDGFWAKLHQDFGIQPASVPPHPTADHHPATPPLAATAHPTPAPHSHPGPASPPPVAHSAAPAHSDSAAPAPSGSAAPAPSGSAATHPGPAAAAHSGPAAPATSGSAAPGPPDSAVPGTSGSAAPAHFGPAAAAHSGPGAAADSRPAAPAQSGSVAGGSDAAAPVGSGRDGATHADGARPGPAHSGPAAPADTGAAPSPATAAHHPVDPEADGARPAPGSDSHAPTTSTPAHT
jgi:uncharacterized LabA/DUF88 family protein